MKISTKGRYALRLMTDVAAHDETGYVSLKDVAARQNISPKYLEQIAGLLAKAGMLQRILRFSKDNLPKFMDATDALGAAYCHFLQLSKPDTGERHYNSWKDYVRSHKERIANQG